ncbi:hypothetical protein [Parasitella parasitica]|uniref:SH3 domain-containing protein n=1 Tax=Parasitella parasitica TaxID=35722 RepID=A0A0B7MRF2_9FUNG|nr:hypothetical protein [Parasitella parasitica]
MSLPLLIFSTAFIAVNPTEASPFDWDINKRAESTTQKFANSSASTKKATTTTTKKATASTTKKASTTTKETSAAKKSTSAKAISPSASSPLASSAVNPTSAVSVQPSAMAVNPTPVGSSSGVIASSTSIAQKDTVSSDNSSGISGGAIGGIVAAIVIIIAGILAYLFLRRKRNVKNRNMNSRMSKPDPFTMGFGSDQAFQSAQSSYQQQQTQMQQVNTAPYQHQYGTVQPTIAVTSPTPPSLYHNSSDNNTTQFHDANNYIIPGSMLPGEQEQQSDSYKYQPQPNQQYQPNTIFQQEQSGSHVSIKDTDGSTLDVPVPVTGVVQQQQALLQPTQAGSVGVFYVAATYTPTLSDEIDIQTGDQVEVLVEYDDGWCQGINLTRGNTKGVFPKHCIDYTALGTTSNGEVDRSKRVSSMYIAQ